MTPPNQKARRPLASLASYSLPTYSAQQPLLLPLNILIIVITKTTTTLASLRAVLCPLTPLPSPRPSPQRDPSLTAHHHEWG